MLDAIVWPVVSSMVMALASVLTRINRSPAVGAAMVAVTAPAATSGTSAPVGVIMPPLVTVIVVCGARFRPAARVRAGDLGVACNSGVCGGGAAGDRHIAGERGRAGNVAGRVRNVQHFDEQGGELLALLRVNGRHYAEQSAAAIGSWSRRSWSLCVIGLSPVLLRRRLAVGCRLRRCRHRFQHGGHVFK